MRINKRINYDQYIIFYLVIMSFELMAEYYWKNGSSLAMYIFRLMSFNTIIFPIFLSLYNKLKLDSYRVYFLWVFIFNSLVTLLNLSFGEGRNMSNVGIYFGMLSALLMAPVELVVLHKAFKKIAIFGCIVLIYVFASFEIDMTVALRRGYTWTEIFYYASFYWAVIPFVIMSFLKEKYIKISIVYWMCAIILNLMFLKRFIIVDSVLLMCIISFIMYRKNNERLKQFLKTSVYISLMLLVSLIVFGEVIMSLFNEVLSRFQLSGLFSTFDRFIETQNYFKNVPIVDVLIGKGFLGTHSGLGVEADALHVGWSNFILKGGVLLLSVIVIPYIKMIFLLPQTRDFPIKIQFSVYMMMVYAIRLMYTNMHTFNPEIVVFFYCLFNVMDYKNSRNPKNNLTLLAEGGQENASRYTI